MREVLRSRRNFDGLVSNRAIAWRAADSLSLREFLAVPLREAPPDHSTVPAAGAARSTSRRMKRSSRDTEIYLHRGDAPSAGPPPRDRLQGPGGGPFSPRTTTMYMPLRNVCCRTLVMADPDEQDEARRLYASAPRSPPATTTRPTCRRSPPRPASWSETTGSGPPPCLPAATGGDVNGRFLTFDDRTGDFRSHRIRRPSSTYSFQRLPDRHGGDNNQCSTATGNRDRAGS